jgi:GNAT superfamily N-acetyltransferase
VSEQGLRVQPVRDARGLHQFIEAAYQIRGRELYWVPPPRKSVRDLLDRRRHPFHKHAEVEYFLAFRGDRVVGRIAAIENHAHNEFHGERTAFFGFLDADNDPEVFAALLAACEQWARSRKLSVLRGPCSFSTNEECGLLVQGYDSPPCVMMPWNPPSYPAHVEAAGYGKARDLYSWWISEDCYNERFAKLRDLVRTRLERKGLSITTRTLDKKRFTEELAVVREIYNRAWEKNWGFVPMTEAEINHMAAELRPLLVPEFVTFVEVNGSPAAFSFSLPDYNVPLRFMQGKLGPLQALIFLLLKPRINMVRMLTMGIVEEYRKLGLESLLIGELIDQCRARGIAQAELGWILEDNALMNQTLKGIGARHYKTHRLYEKAIATT